MKTKLFTFVLCAFLCQGLFSQSVAVWKDGAIEPIADVDSTEIFSRQDKPYLNVWSSGSLAYSDFADSLQFFPVGEDIVIPVTSITLNNDSTGILLGGQALLTATVLPDNATDKTVAWTTSNSNVAIVQDGLVTAVDLGSAVITAKSGNQTAECKVTVVPIEVESVTLDRESASILLGGTTTLTATVMPDNATDKTVTWTTSDASVASVSNGVVTANKLGTATITATSGTKSAECQITVLPIEVESVTLDNDSIGILLGGQALLTATVLPDNATDKTVAWTTSNSNVAIVQDGLVTAVDLGSAVITAKSGNQTAECKVTVVPIEVESVTLDRESAEILLGGTTTLTATVLPDNATDKTVTWTTSDASVASVSNGVVTANKLGTATITATSGTKSAECQITVLPIEVESVTLDRTTASILLGGTTTLTATVLPDNATDKTVTWTTSDASVASVSNGVVTANKLGTATITATSGTKSAECQITVLPIEVTSVTLDRTTASILLGGTTTLTATVMPDNATDKTVTWTTSDANVASVSNGVVTANKLGTATITATSGTKSAECQITVLPIEVESVTLDNDSIGILLGGQALLTATVLPDNATDKTVAWTTSNSNVAIVQDGLVTAVDLGSAVITAKSGNQTAECKVTVVPIEVESVTLDRESAEILLGGTTTLTATVLPDNATDKTVTWTTSDASVASVSNGVVTANKLGTATITATSGTKSAECQITVLPIEVESVTLDRTTASILLGGTTTLTATVLPDNATDKTVTWTTSDASVASVSNGVVTANKLGTATITATSGTKSAECQITVLPIEVTSVTLDRTTASILLGSTTTLTATVLPDNATDKTVTWTTSDASVASVSNGVVTANKLGTATITATSGTKSAECQITVLPIEVESVTLDRTTASILLGGTTTLTATVLPDNATYKDVVWTTSDASVASVSNGVVTANKLGTATITATSGTKSAECQITVLPIEVESVTLDRTTASILLGGTTTLTATVLPDNATYKDVVWTTSDASVASVSNGVVTANKLGTATITATSGTKSAECQITVLPIEVESVTLDRTTASILLGGTTTLTATVLPDNATYKDVVWTTSDASVASVSNGVVTANKLGTATITATSGTKSAECQITVLPIEVTSITLDRTTASILLGSTTTLTATVLPDNATYKDVVWTTSDASVASVDNGIVTANKLGTATITATSGSMSARCQITVLPIEVESLTISVTEAKMEIGETLTIVPTILPVNATNRNVVWTSSNEAVASVVNGVVTANKAGNATITAALETFEVTCKITVYPDGLRPQIDEWGEGENISGEAE